jgi:endonuclease/exonuclease/phosphatase family metal-dependent hydrolase
MRTLVFWLCLGLGTLTWSCAPLASDPTQGRPHASHPTGSVPLRLAVWNVANLFDTVDDPYNDPVLSLPEYENKLRQVAAVVEALEGDFVGLVEVENLACLQALNQTLPTPYPQLGLIEGNDTQRGIDVAFLSRVPVARVVSHRDHDLPDAPGVSSNYRFSRDCLEVVLDTEPPVTLLLNHLKSQLGGKKESAAKRHVQAQGIVEIAQTVAEQRPQGVEVVLGDLNDRPDSWSLEPVMKTFVDPFANWSQAERATHRSRHGATPLDYILVSHKGQRRAQEPKVWQGLGKKTSDHDPVSLVLRLDDVPARAEPKSWSQSD